MKRLLALVLTLAPGIALSAGAQAPAVPAAAPGAPAKVAVIAFQAVVVQTNEFQRNLADLQKKYEPKRQQIKTLSDEIDTLSKQLQAQGATLSEAERAARAGAIDAKRKQLDRDTEDAQNDFQQDLQNMFTAVAAKVYGVMSTYVRQQGYTLVLDASKQPTPVLYAVGSTNIAKPVLDAYNLKSGVPAPPRQQAASAPKPTATHKPVRTPPPPVRH